MDEDILNELQEIKKLLQVISSNKEPELDVKKNLTNEKEYYDRMIYDTRKRFKERFGVYPDQISLVAKAENILPQLYINLL